MRFPVLGPRPCTEYCVLQVHCSCGGCVASSALVRMAGRLNAHPRPPCSQPDRAPRRRQPSCRRWASATMSRSGQSWCAATGSCSSRRWQTEGKRGWRGRAAANLASRRQGRRPWRGPRAWQGEHQGRARTGLEAASGQRQWCRCPSLQARLSNPPQSGSTLPAARRAAARRRRRTAARPRALPMEPRRAMPWTLSKGPRRRRPPSPGGACACCVGRLGAQPAWW